MTEAIDQLSRSERRRLLQQLREHRRETGEAPAQTTIPRQGGEGPYPLSYAQQRLWFLDQLEPGLIAYNISRTLRLTGRLDSRALARSLEEIARRHEALRTTFSVINGEPAQVIGPPAPADLPVIDLSGLPEEMGEPLAFRLATWEVRRPFDLTRGPLLRTVLLHLAPDDWIATFATHHIVSDGWSLGVFVRELVQLYAGFVSGQRPSLPALPIQYGDYARWQRQWLAGPVLEKQIDYWRQRLAGPLPSLILPADHPYPAVRTYRGTRKRVAFSPEFSERLRSLGRSREATLFMILLSAVSTLLHRYTGEEDLLIGSPVTGRRGVETEDLIGFFINTVVLRVDLSGQPTFAELLERVRETALGAYAHQDLPFERLVEELQPERNLSRHPLFQVMTVLVNTPTATTLSLPGLVLTPVATEFGSSRLDLALEFTDAPFGLSVMLEYSTELFEAPTITHLAVHLDRLLRGMTENLDLRISDLPLLDEAERQQIVFDWNDTWRALPERPGLHQLFARQAERAPDAPAALSGQGVVSYGELARQAGRIALRLHELGMTAESRVALCVERSPAALAAMLGILEAGGAYVPLDPESPVERLAGIVADAGARILATQRHLAPRLEGLAERVLLLDDEDGGGGSLPAARPVAPDSAAYVVYTSGSTGAAKGVVATHRGTVNFVLGIADALALGPADRLLLFAPLSFDASVLQIFPTLASGASLVIHPNPRELTACDILDLCARHGVTVLDLPASLWQQWVEEVAAARLPLPKSLRAFLTGGESVPAARLRTWAGLADRPVSFLSSYGPTEATVTATVWQTTSREAEALTAAYVPIGRPLPNTRVYALDRTLRPVPRGVAGELFLGGAGLARGYLGRPDLTAATFIPDPLSGAPGGRLYRTGDLGRYRLDGDLEFLGRADDQVKIRGFRIEPGEIEAALAQHPAVRHAVVVMREDRPGDRRLAAYVVARDGAPEPTGEELRHWLMGRLPEPMVPSTFTALDRLPVLASGKVDRRALPVPEPARVDPAARLAAPRNPVEQVLAAIWEEVLGVDRIGFHDDFFALGGHSLLATQVVSQVRATLGVELPLRTLFEDSTLAGLAARIERLRQAGLWDQAPPLRPVPRDHALPLSFAQERMWVLHQIAPESPIYNIPLALRMGGSLDVPALARTLDRIVERHETLRTTFAIRDGQPVQVISPAASVPLPVLDLSHLPEAERDAVSRRLVLEEINQPFDLSRLPVVRALLLRLSEREHVFLVILHHVSCDGWSIGVLTREVAAIYTALVEGREPELPELPLQYADFAVWQRGRLQGDFLAAQMDYWRNQLASAPSVLALPTDYPRPAVQRIRGGRESLDLPDDLIQPLRALGRSEGSTSFMVLLAAFQALLHRSTGQDTIVVGTPVANRERAEIEGLIGFFVNTLPLRADLGDDPGFRQLLARVRDTALDAYTHQEIPFEKLVEELQTERDMSRAPIFQVFFVLVGEPTDLLRLPHLELLPFGKSDDERMARYDLTLACSEHANGLMCHVDYDRNLFDPVSMASLLRQLSRLLAGVAADPDAPITEIPLLDEEERRQVLFAWNDTRLDFAEGPGLHHLFERQAALTPEAPAAISAQETLTYGELARRARELAGRLRRLGVAAESRVAFCIERSPDALVALLGILAAGGAYVPLDPEAPSERLAGILADSGAGLLITRGHLAPRLSGLPGRLLLIEDQDEAGGWSPAASPVTPDNAAYVIYTSGSTGAAKGVVATHRGAVNFVHGLTRALGLGPADRLLLFAPLSFDASVLQVFPTLASGAALVLHPNPRELTTRDILDLCARHGITVLDLPAALWRQWVEDVAASRLPLPESLRAFLTGGESVPAARLRTWATLADRPLSFLSSYGPTEATVTTTVWQAGNDSAPTLAAAHVPIGRPLPNAQVYVLDRKLQPVPRGAAGELFLGGAGLARGYLGRPDLTAEAFVPDPLSGEPGARLYRTGDLGRHRPEGDLEFLGRADNQLKIRGFRVEPGEVEAALARFPGVRQAAVMPHEEVPGDPYLVAYVAFQEDGQVDETELRSFLSGLLPSYMVPATCIALAELPVLASGKLNRRALPSPAGVRSERSVSFVAPRDPVEQILAEIWAQVLRVERVGVFDHFFELGGHSLLATQALARIRQVFEIDLQLRSLFEEPTVAGLTASLRGSPDADKVEKTAALRIELAGLSEEEVEALLLAEADAEKGLSL
jgi:amino acid adenylation domain-containing protein